MTPVEMVLGSTDGRQPRDTKMRLPEEVELTCRISGSHSSEDHSRGLLLHVACCHLMAPTLNNLSENRNSSALFHLLGSAFFSDCCKSVDRNVRPDYISLKLFNKAIQLSKVSFSKIVFSYWLT